MSEPAQDLVRDIAMRAAMRRRNQSVFEDSDIKELLEEAHLTITVSRPEPCVIRPDAPHVCVRPDHAGLHGTPRQETT